jgi:transposase
MPPGPERRCQGRGRARAQKRLPAEVRQQLLDAIYSGQPFRTVLRDLGRTSNQVWGFTKTNQEWSERLEAALTATRRDDLQHGTNAAYVHGCVCRECRAHQRRRMARNRG